VHFLDGAYFACTEVDGGLVSLNLVLDRARFLAERQPRDEVLESWLARVPALGERIARGRRVDPVRGLGPLARRTTRQTFDGAALVGDAAGYVDPVTGEGIWFALEGARILCVSAVPALHAAGRVDHAALAGYRRARGRVLAPRAAFATLLQRGLRHPRLVRGVLGLLEERPGLADVLVSVTGDYVSFRELVRPRTWLAAAARVPARCAS
jgi:flavin-dependent dehydrogenase